MYKRQVFDSVQDFIFIKDRNRRYLIINSFFQKRFHVDPSVFLGHTDEEIPIFENKDKTGAIIQNTDALVLQGETAHYELTHRVCGTLITFDIMKTPIRDGQGNITGICGLSRDITERKQTEYMLRRSEEKFRFLTEHMNDNIFTMDMNLQTTYVSKSVEKILGFTPEERMKQDVSEQVTPNSLAVIGEILSAELEREQKGLADPDRSIKFEVEFYHKDGSTRWVENVISGIRDNEGALIGIHGVSRDISERKESEEKLTVTLESLRKAFGTIVQVMVSAVESRDPYTAGHQNRSADLARAIATEMGLSQDKIDGISMAGSIHDIGKLSVPAEILAKPTKLSEIEFPLVKQHALKGYEMLKDVESPWPLAEMVYQHHERMDGSGYPRCLKGDEILMEARILAVADVVESMASHRPYRPALGIDAALAEIENNKGTLYDTDVGDACLRLFREKGFQLEGIRF